MTPHDTIGLLDSDSDSDEVPIEYLLSDHEATIDNSPAPTDDDVDDEYQVDITGEEWRKANAQRSQGLPPGHRHINYFDAYGVHRLEPGMGVPLLDSNFFRIKFLTQDKCTRDVSMHGWVLKRHFDMNAQMKKSTGELAMEIFADEKDERADLERGSEELPISRIDFFAPKLSREIIFTNRTIKAWRGDPRSGKKELRDEVWAHGTLVCRMKNVRFYSVKGGKVMKPHKEAWIWLREEESDKGYGVPDKCKTIHWLQEGDRPLDEIVPARARTCSESVISSERRTKRSRITNEDDLVEIEESKHREVIVKSTTRRTGERTLALDNPPEILKSADVCCGAGGVSRGMQKAGFQPAVGVDWWHPAARTFALNFPAATTIEMDISDFVHSVEARFGTYCHAVHISWPCPYHSPAHTRSNNPERDDKNRFLWTATEALLKALRPMYVTFENTSGLKELSKHRDDFNSFIKMLTDLGWSAVFKVTKLSDYGNSHKRRRLIVIAACPGMPLIDFPLPTHGTEPGLLPQVTVGSVIGGIDRNDPLHNSRELRVRQRKQPSNMRPADKNAPLRELISTSGPKVLHPSARRQFTSREGMRLMGLPDNHQLSPVAKTSKEKWTLIGNGFPPQLPQLICTKVYELLQSWLAEYHSPISLDMDTDENIRTASRPTPKRKNRASNAFERNNTEDEDMLDIPTTSFAASKRSAKRLRTEDADTPAMPRSLFAATPAPRQTTVDGMFAVKKETTTRPTPVEKTSSPSDDRDVVDLTAGEV